VGYTGADALIWGSDYPHHEGTYQHSRATVARLSESLDEDTAARVFRQNVIELFHFDRSLLDRPLAPDEPGIGVAGSRR
jgi:predicted TIM-barrel fold metal-dependent hydrolase